MPANSNDYNAFARMIAASLGVQLDALTEKHGCEYPGGSTGEHGDYGNDVEFAFHGVWAASISPQKRAAMILANAYARPIYAECAKCSDEHYLTAERPSDWKSNPDMWPRYPEDNPDGSVHFMGVPNIAGHDRQHLPINWMRALAKQAGLFLTFAFNGQPTTIPADEVAKAILGVYSRRVVGILRNLYIGKPGLIDSWRAEGKTIETILNAIEFEKATAQDESDYRTFYENNLVAAYTTGWGTPLVTKNPDYSYHSPALLGGQYFQPNELAVIVPALYRLALWMDAVGYEEKWRAAQWLLVDRHCSLVNSAVGANGEVPDFVSVPNATPITPPSTFDLPGMVKSYPIWNLGAPPSVFTYSKWLYLPCRIAELRGFAECGPKANAILKRWQSDPPEWSVLGFDSRNWMVRPDGTHETKP